MVSATALDALERLVAIRSVSPLSAAATDELTAFFAPHGFRGVEGPCWVREVPGARDWVYAHADTKPPLPRDEWTVEPYALTARGERLFGLGISDAKFQLLNALAEFVPRSVNILIDGGEEIGAAGAAALLRARGARRLVIVDGATASNRVYTGFNGQLDGCITFDTGVRPQHPAREHRTAVLDRLAELRSYTGARGLRFNLTGLHSERRERSLTLESVEVRFDLRFSERERAAVDEFVRSYAPTVRQRYEPLETRSPAEPQDLVAFCTPLGRLDGVDYVRVVPGGLPENGNHRPDEWIFAWQIARHRDLLRRFADEERLGA